MLPSVTIVATTYFPEGRIGEERYNAYCATKNSWEKHLKYETGNLHLHVSDDGSNERYSPYGYFNGYLVSGSKQMRKGVGSSLNAGFRRAYEYNDPKAIVLYAVDDWSLTQDFDITPWVKLLVEREDVGIVRLGMPHPNISGTIEMFTEDWQGWGLRLDRKGFAFGHRPALYHRRMIDHYGWFEEGVSALECERLYNEKFCADPTGPDIVLALPHSWYHIDTISLSSMEPK